MLGGMIQELLQDKPANYDDFFGRVLAWTQVQSIPQWPGYKYCLDPVIMTNDHLLKFLVVILAVLYQ